MGAGRCGSTSLISFLNKQANFNIYGENNNVISNLLETIFLLEDIRRYNGLSHKQTRLNSQAVKYIGSEWYNPRNKINHLKEKLNECVLEFFDNPEEYIGFKEIRWSSNIKYLNFFEQYFNVKYIHLVRNIEDQIKSINRLKWKLKTDTEQYILLTNKIITNFLQTRKPKQHITKNISIDKNFQQEIYNFITEQNKNFSSHPIDNADD